MRFQKVATDRQILLVGEDQEDSVSQLILIQHALELFTSLDNTITIVAVDDEDDTLGVLEVMSPQGTDLVLATDIPHGELNVLVLHGLNVEALGEWSVKETRRQWRMARGGAHTDGGDGCDDFAELQLVEDGGLSGGVQTNHQDSHLLLAPEPVEQLRECETHLGDVE